MHEWMALSNLLPKTTSLLADCVVTSGKGVKYCIEKERKALLLFKQGIHSNFVGMLSTWTNEEDKDCCNWRGVHCNKETGHVQILDLRGGVDLSSVYLRGRLNITSIIELQDLEYLDLSNNYFFSSEIPESIESFTNSGYLNLSLSSFIGSIPYQLGKLLNLLSIDLGNNNLDGAIPWQIGNLSKLRCLNLGGNYLVGAIPYQIGNLSMLHTLELSSYSNGLTIVDQKNHNTEWLLKLSSLTKVDLSYTCDAVYPHLWVQMIANDIHFLSSHFHFPSLVVLDLSCNNLISLRALNFGSNLQGLYLSNCSISSDNLIFTSSNPNLTSLVYLDLSFNHLTSSTLFYWISNFTFNLHELRLYDNLLGGLIPYSFGNIMSSLEVLSLHNNKLQGEIPPSLGNMCTLKELELSYNDLSKELLSFVSNASWCNGHSLERLSLSSNQLTGEIPHSIGDLMNLEALILKNNSLIGELPSSLMNCTNLLLLDVSENKLLGPIPSWIGKSLGELQILSLWMNNFYGSLPLNICYLA
ncbi:receptor-like protein EIX1 [Prosopis cineraria]|uniref:receptor-like protein EIX1 n=1 Tax=Prosopis cineraria TaxID=364024 RepID=UPI002410938B|nr:receptor-like protein EIX1 [Prosopis cineraria]